MTDHSALIMTNQKQWDNAKFAPSMLALANRVAARLTASDARARYEDVSAKTGVPWWVIAVIHEREASQRWDRNIAQGDPWGKVSTHVPKGRGPFTSWEEAAIDALTNCAPFAARWTDWSMGGALTLLELYNGLGYETYHHMASPYLWSGTQHYAKGKYVADGKFDPDAVDQQLGCAVLLHAMGIGGKSEPQTLPATKQVPGAKHAAGGTVVVVAAGTAAHQAGAPMWAVILIACAVAAIALFVIHKITTRQKG